MCIGSSGGCKWFVRGANRFGEDCEEDHASSSDSAKVWTLLRPAAGGHWISGTLWSLLFLFFLCLLRLSNPAHFNVSCRWWSSPSPLSFCHLSAALTWRTGATDGRLNIHTHYTETLSHKHNSTVYHLREELRPGRAALVLMRPFQSGSVCLLLTAAGGMCVDVLPP